MCTFDSKQEPCDTALRSFRTMNRRCSRGASCPLMWQYDEYRRAWEANVPSSHQCHRERSVPQCCNRSSTYGLEGAGVCSACQLTPDSRRIRSAMPGSFSSMSWALSHTFSACSIARQWSRHRRLNAMSIRDSSTRCAKSQENFPSSPRR